MVYQYHLTKFVILRPLRSKTADEVCENIVDIFTLFGAPSILQSDNGREFANKVINSLQNVWPNFRIVHGKPRHSQSQGSVERANQDIENMITTWMQDHKTSLWSDGLKYVQLMKNSALHSGIKRSPYEAMFGCPPKHGLSTTQIPTEVISTLESEEDLQNIIDQMKNQRYTENENSNSNEDQNVENSKNTVLTNDNITSNEIDISMVCENSPGNQIAVEEDSYQLTDLDKSTLSIKKHREQAFQCLNEQANRMKHISDHANPPVEKGTTVRIPVPDVDCGGGDARSILGVILEVQDEFYKIGTRDGILRQHYARSQFSPCPKNMINENEVPMDKEVALRTVATAQSSGSGQGFFRCSCKTKCMSKKCFCKKKNVKCNSKCHSSMPCSNK
uniref:Uncharacterized protein LOC114347864 n=1 Tax=Diabrotica virgifera virgifera TaxID=50390 RepID=A0A6P7GY04_DIAVI